MELQLSSPSGLRAKWFSLGATLAELHVPDRDGEIADVVWGFDDESGYSSAANQNFGCTIGRVANRIAAGQFSLDGRTYQLAINNGPNHLHGGVTRCFAKVNWTARPFDNASGVGVEFTYVSLDGEEGYPGAVDVSVVYTLTNAGAVEIAYTAQADRPTPLNLTNHSYFNLSGHNSPTVLDHLLLIDADRYLPKDETGIPTGEILGVSGTPFDFRQRKPIHRDMNLLAGPDADGYDHNFVLNGDMGAVRLVAEVHDPASGRTMRVHTDQPGMQLYTSNRAWGQKGKNGYPYDRHGAVCLETQHYPDSPNKPHFPSIILRPDETYRHTCIYDFSTTRNLQ